MKVTSKATLSKYELGLHFTSGLIIDPPEHASIAESFNVVHHLLEELARRNVKSGTKLRISIETMPKKKKP